MTKVGLLRFCEQCSSPVGDLEQHRLFPLCFWFSNVITHKIKMYCPFFPPLLYTRCQTYFSVMDHTKHNLVSTGIDQQNHKIIAQYPTKHSDVPLFIWWKLLQLHWKLAHIITDLFRKSFWHVGVDMFLLICLLCLFCKLTNAWIENQKGLFPLLHSLTSVQGYLIVHSHDGMHSSGLATTEYI